MSGGAPWPLPETWQWATFQDVAEVRSDLKDPRATPEAVHIAPNHIETSTGQLLGRGSVAGDKVTSPKHAFHAGQILYSKIRPYLAKAVLVDFEGLCSADMYPVSVDARMMDPRIFHRWLISQAFTDAASESQGRTVLPKINQAALNTKPVPIPPLEEQRRVSAKVEALLGRAYACRRRLESVPALLKRLRQSVLVAATSGELTREWREQVGIHRDWPAVSLEDVATGFSYGSAAKSSKSGRVPVLRMGNIQDGRLDWRDLVFTSDPDEIEKYKLSAGDLLFNRTNSPELVGKTAVFRGEREAVYAGYLIRVRCGDELLPDYLNYCLGSPLGRDYCWRVKSDGVSQSNINATKLAAFTFDLPSVNEQMEIVRRVEDLLGSIRALEAGVRRASEITASVVPAVLANAYCGKLVPQNPNDEPASVMLERIRAQRAANVCVPESAARRRPPAPPRAQRVPKRTGAKKRRAS